MSSGDTDTADQRADLRAQIELLEAENSRLREEYADAVQPQYRQTAIALLGVALLALGVAVFMPALRDVLISIAAIGVFAAILMRSVTPSRFLAASVGEQVYETLAINYRSLVTDLGLTDQQVYVPTETETGTTRLFVPQYRQYELPPAAELDGFVVTDNERERGLALQPIGQGLYAEFRRGLSGPLATAPQRLATQLTDALIEQFELVEAASVDSGDGQLTIGLRDVAYTEPTELDHPAVSLLAVGVAQGLAVPVRVSLTDGDSRFEQFVILRWDSR